MCLRRFSRCGWVVAALVAVAACGGGGAAKHGATQLIMAEGAITGNLDPAVYDAPVHVEPQLDYEGRLVRQQPFSVGSSMVSPDNMINDLADSITVTGSSLTVKLKAAKTSNGKVLSADDVKYSFDREIALRDSIGLFFLGVAGLDKENPVTVIDASTVKFSGPLSPFTKYFLGEFAILDSEAVKSHATAADPWAKGWLATHSASFGPYDVESFQPAQQVTMVENKNYWGNRPHFKTVILRAVPDSSSELQLIKSHSVQVATGISAEDFATLQGDGTLQAVLVPTASSVVMELNKKFAPFKDPDVRQAISLAINRADLVKGPYHGAVGASNTIVSAAMPGVKDAQPLPYDVTKAKSLLAKAGYAGGFTISFGATQSETGSANVDSLTVYLKTQLAQIGVNVNVNLVPSPADYRSAYVAGKFDAFLRSEGPVVPDANYDLTLYHKTGGLSNFQGDNDTAVDGLLTQSAPLALGSQRNQLMQQAIDKFTANMWDVPLVYTKNPIVLSKGVCGFKPTDRLFVDVSLLNSC